MLYVTTANKHDVFTAHYSLCHDCTKEGGLFLPYQMPKLSAGQIDALKNETFGDRVANILNLLFSTRLNGWDIDFCIGRSSVRLVSLNQRVLIAETWHNLDSDFCGLVRNVSDRLLSKEYIGTKPSRWIWIAVRVAVLFGVFGELEKIGLTDSGSKINFTVAAGDFSAPFAIWYAREMGLPVGNIIVSCDENSGLWELLHNGQMRVDPGFTPRELERFIFAAAGHEAVQNFRDVLKKGGIYTPNALVFKKLRQGMIAEVVSRKRMESVICNTYSNYGYILETDSAQAYSGLQNYMARAGETGAAVILAEKNPICSASTVADAMGIGVRELKRLLDVT